MQKKWWHDKIAYQIYPKSFYDADGDGIGDLRGIINKLDYLQELGVDILWLSPIFCSPLADQGYDISDYYNIDPRFGTMDDMEELIARAREKNMYILMDLVVNHCSDEHIWFKEALKDPDGRYGKYFYIEEGKDGKPPCNWRSYFGGSAWEIIPGTDKYYFHAFHKKQPDLNWENPEVRQEIYKMINWWLNKGLGGFRIDAIINIKKVLPFKDYKPDREDGMVSIKTMLKEAEGIGEFLSEMKRETFEKYDAFTVGEVFDAKEEEMPLFFGEDGYFSSIFEFGPALIGKSANGWYDCQEVTTKEYKATCFRSQEKADKVGFMSNIIENHDEPRGVNEFISEEDLSETSKKLLAAIYFLQKGIPFIYQGQELGMENTVFHSIEEVDDISTKDEYQIALDAGCSKEEALRIVSKYSRDNARTPFQWNDGINAGFSEGKSWLPLNPNYPSINAKEQMGREDSVFHFYRKLIELRKEEEYKEVLVYGKFVPVLPEKENFMAYLRKGQEKTILVAANFQRECAAIKLPVRCKKILLNNYEDVKREGSTVIFDGYQVVVMEVEQLAELVKQ
ncbi:glycoside hydrolase family 13 protein [Anaerocolumna xylanovorans]|uniref:Oligo-1,6-glucosidase n=1 Tax=Anaerocolumna xylanovorans DSM 12503 TaxID=1121345 RepID=A0A1M7YFL2_9FIRM|nr:alpha-glucosidase [Anaerocolumna xylanovorans]SHO51298.1 oligo-1,6-glucosidase [Anaerocolumna xylanovorans DSM 12503]